ncbi:OLC1v1019314C1 [Oldenlandia corymbosa var. corymbosa]|uniref:OLC1v1019314C1 n=1 Tax=Oldenlandia corymbosa var. corymbosa TaxID=529605 RepID=A0AAV1EDR6_OLDCO|nr:OLC1v1019314C1 [Oldenlandia corymbosa var. corymbosa]
MESSLDERLERCSLAKDHHQEEEEEEEEDPNTKWLARLPQEIIVEVLLRLPVRSLSRFRCVSKPWRSLISSSKFMNSNLKKSNEHERDDNYSNRSLLLVSMVSLVINMHSCSLHSVIHDKSSVKLHEVEPPKRCFYPALYILGSCNGIFGILEGYHDTMLWNPTIKHLKKLPNSDTNYRRYKIFSYGFGYDELNDDYKVVEICCYARLGINRETIVNVYSLKSNSWRRIQDYEGGMISGSPGVFFNGVLHWLTTHRDGLKRVWSILSLEISSETHGTRLMLPQSENGFDPMLGVLKGRLCVFCNYYQQKMDVWMMNEYGNNESWSKFASIPYSLDIRGRILPLSVSKSGEILVRCGYSFMLYNKGDGSFSDTAVKMDDPTSLDEAVMYTESLVSPYLYDDARDQI